MAIKVRVQGPLRSVTGGQAEVLGEGRNVSELLQDLNQKYPGLGQRIFAQDGNIQRFLNIFVNDEDIRFLSGVETQLSERDEVSIIPAMAGGAR